MVNYYEILGVSSSATKNDIKFAFKKLAIKFHPDKNPGNKPAEDQFKKINEAYQTLSNDTKRLIYNEKLEYYLFQQRNYVPPVSTNTWHTHYQTPVDRSANYSSQGKYYTDAPLKPRERQSDYYIIGITLFIMIATVSLLFGFLMNRIAARDHYKTAVYKYEVGDYYAAVTELNKAIEFNDHFAEAYELRADIRVKFEQYEKALTDYNLAIKNTENPSDALFTKRDFCRTLFERSKKAIVQ